jgi:hypothetical protein
MKTYSIHTFVVIIMIAFCISPLNGWSQKATISLDSASIQIGERTNLRINVTLPKTASVYWPPFADTLSEKVEIATKSKVDSVATSRNEYVNYRQTLEITSFDTGYHFIPSQTLWFTYNGDTARHSLSTEGLYLHVSMPVVDTTKAIRDIRGPMQAPVTFAELVPLLISIALLALIILGIWYYLWRKKQNKPLFPVVTRPVGPPWQVALEDLENLEKKKLWQQGKIKDYYTELTDILRSYLKFQHSIDALEMTSYEILQAFDQSGLPPTHRGILNNILQRADFAKFAKATPSRQENEISLQEAIQFIENTKPQIADNSEKNSQNAVTEKKF